MEIKALYDEATFTLTYAVWDPATKDAVIIDPVLDYEPLASQTSVKSVEEVTQLVRDHDLKVHYILETHAHADHLSGSQLLKRRFEAGVVIGEHIRTVQQKFKEIFDLPGDFKTDGSQFDKLLADGETLEAGSLRIKAIYTPGHTPACVSYLIGDALFTGDALFMHDYGTGRCDFPAGSADALYTSVHDKLYELPDETRVFVGHDYRPNGREVGYETTIGRSKTENPQLRAETTREEFVRMRNERDAQLSPPRLIFQSVQVNIDAGRLPPRHDNGIRYLRLPLNLFGASTDDAGMPVD
jgi:glyoxylase-like metal-dependent hydrolase (beta-lactamase superfamily II)